jgi:hypothetical protein
MFEPKATASHLDSTLVRCLRTLLSVVARELPLCWRRLTVRACSNRGARGICGDPMKARELYLTGADRRH